MASIYYDVLTETIEAFPEIPTDAPEDLRCYHTGAQKTLEISSTR